MTPWVAILGIDGSGKSSVLRHLASSLGPPIVAGVTVKHRRPDLFKKERPHTSDPYARPPHHPWASLIKLTIVVADWIIGYWLIVRPLRRRGWLVVFDRYYWLDMQIDPRRYRYGGPVGLIPLAARWLPQPTLIILLDVPPETAQARKQEVSFEESARQRQAYLDAVRALSNGYIVDGTQALDAVTADMRQIIVKHLSRSDLPLP